MSAPRRRTDGRWFAPAISWFTLIEAGVFVLAAYVFLYGF